MGDNRNQQNPFPGPQSPVTKKPSTSQFAYNVASPNMQSQIPPALSSPILNHNQNSNFSPKIATGTPAINNPFFVKPTPPKISTTAPPPTIFVPKAEHHSEYSPSMASPLAQASPGIKPTLPSLRASILHKAVERGSYASSFSPLAEAPHVNTKKDRRRSTRGSNFSSLRRKPMMRDEIKEPPIARLGATSSRWDLTIARPQSIETAKKPREFKWWTTLSWILTCCCIPPFLRWAGKRDAASQQAWREKVSLCIIILILSLSVSFITIAVQPLLCADNLDSAPFLNETTNLPYTWREGVVIQGLEYKYSNATGARAAIETKSAGRISLPPDYQGAEISKLFKPTVDYCAKYYTSPQAAAIAATCTVPKPYPRSPPLTASPNECASMSWLANVPRKRLFVGWDDLVGHFTVPPNMFTVYNGIVLNVTSFLAPQQSTFNTTIQTANMTLPPAVIKTLRRYLAKDATKRFRDNAEHLAAVQCLAQKYSVAFIEKDTPSCFSAMLLEILILVIILLVVAIRFTMAVVFYWTLSGHITKPKKGTRSYEKNQKLYGNGKKRVFEGLEESDDPLTIMLVTCYSEGEAGIKTTLDSLSSTHYPDNRKLIFIVADGMIVGSGNTKATPDICCDLVSLNRKLGPIEPKSYISIAEGAKQHNMAKVYAGHYTIGNHFVPVVIVAKTGTPSEASQAKPGNRGKRDSQMILMNFLSRVMFDDRMTPLDYDIFWKIQAVTGYTPDVYETILMVDADTKVLPDALRYMNDAMKYDDNIMGLCGETRIENKRASWVTAIQVFEYYISHHLGKAFESVFGGVTCLPGCFSMYRIKSYRASTNSWYPILVAPDILDEYSENVVDTLHKKNLLLLGEDRFLSTLMLRNFPRRRMVFVPQAICKTEVPDKFNVLLSQRRRWINSTVHNLMELVLVQDLCGTFCFSMQFVVLLELLGTAVMPATIFFLLYLIIYSAVTGVVQIMPMVLLACMLGLPGVLIVITTRKIVYVLWMFVYLLALPIWNFVLPVYAFAHFDDFSWGQTRKVAGEDQEKTHGEKEGEFDHAGLVLKKWKEWEIERRGNVAKYNDDRDDITLNDDPRDLKINEKSSAQSLRHQSSGITLAHQRSANTLIGSTPKSSPFLGVQDNPFSEGGTSPNHPGRPNLAFLAAPLPEMQPGNNYRPPNNRQSTFTSATPSFFLPERHGQQSRR